MESAILASNYLSICMKMEKGGWEEDIGCLVSMLKCALAKLPGTFPNMFARNTDLARKPDLLKLLEMCYCTYVKVSSRRGQNYSHSHEHLTSIKALWLY